MSKQQELHLVEQAQAGDESALAALFEQHRQRLRKMIDLRMTPRLRARCDASDVLQEAFLEVARRIPEYEHRDDFPFFVWLRRITYGRLSDLYRKHIVARKRTANLEVALRSEPISEVSSGLLASHLAGRFTSVHRNLIRAEVEMQLHKVIEAMDEKDRDVIALRYFEGLTTEETAAALDLTRSGVLKRFTRALTKLSQAVKSDSDLNSKG